MSKIILILLIIAGIYLVFIKSRKKNIENEFIQGDKCYTFTLKKDIKLINNKRLCKECYENS